MPAKARRGGRASTISRFSNGCLAQQQPMFASEPHKLMVVEASAKLSDREASYADA